MKLFALNATRTFAEKIAAALDYPGQWSCQKPLTRRDTSMEKLD
jgi:hypothetical protein